MDRRGLGAADDDVPVKGDRIGAGPVPKDVVPPLAAVHPRCADVQQAVRPEARIDGDPHQAGLAHRVDVGDLCRGGAFRVRLCAVEHDDVAHALGHEHPAVGREREVPRDRETGLDDRVGEIGRALHATIAARAPARARREERGEKQYTRTIAHPAHRQAL